jgi:dienelactone hydrolase
MSKSLLAFTLVTVFTLPALAVELHEGPVVYDHDGVACEGYVVHSKENDTKRPLVVVFHQWKGLSDYEKQRARQLAELGYVAFCADVYGRGVRHSSPQDAAKEAGKYKSNRELLRGRANAALAAARSQKMADDSQVAAIGYCFGGTTVLELARSGANVAGVVSFHGGLDSPNPDDGKKIRCKVLALHGADDPFVSKNDLAAFEDEMRKAGVDWQSVSYGGAVHSFTQRSAGDDPSKGAAYNARADSRSWEDMRDFFGELFPSRITGR